jgi:hypothetical protein
VPVIAPAAMIMNPLATPVSTAMTFQTFVELADELLTSGTSTGA